MKYILAAISGLALLIGAGVANAADADMQPGTTNYHSSANAPAMSTAGGDHAMMNKSANVTDKAPAMKAPGKMTGYITAKNDADNEITMDNGYVFKLRSDPGASKLNVGDKLELSWNTFNQDYGVLQADTVKILHRAAS